MFPSLPHFGSAKKLASRAYSSIALHVTQGWVKMTAVREPINWKGILASIRLWLQFRTIASRLSLFIIFITLLAITTSWIQKFFLWFLNTSKQNREKIFPIFAPLASIIGTLATLAVGVFLARAALKQARIATRVSEISAQQAETARQRHEKQTEADFRRRIIESYSKAVTQLASDKLEERLGGIYILENISKESPEDYWMAMENLTAFVRERSQRNNAESTSQTFQNRVSQCAYFIWHQAGRPEGRAEEFWAEAVREIEYRVQADIQAILSVIRRRSALNQEREFVNRWHFNFEGSVLKGANLAKAPLDRAIFAGTHLEGATLAYASLKKAYFGLAHLEEANLEGAHLNGAFFLKTHLEGANLTKVCLEEAWLKGAHLKGADLHEACLEKANLTHACLENATLLKTNLKESKLNKANLRRAKFYGANLKRADLSFANCEGASFHSMFFRTNLDGADLIGTNLVGADLSKVIGLQEVQILASLGDASTRLPAGLTAPQHWPSFRQRA